MSTSAPRTSRLRRQHFSCVLCGASEGRQCARSRGWDVVRCRGCGLRRTWPVPDPELLAKLYDDGYHGERWMSAENHGEWTERARDVLALLATPQTAVLDFGAGDGGLVEGLRAAGVAAEGVETSAAGRRLAAVRGLTLHPAVPPARYSAVTMLHVLEHVPDPVAKLTDLRRVLEPGGLLLVEVPNAGSIDALWPPLRPLVLDLPFHLHHFTPRTLERVIARAGFETVLVRRFNPMALDWLLDRRRPATGSASGGSAASTPALPPRTQTTTARALWHGALPHLRAAAPGLKLQLVARA